MNAEIQFHWAPSYFSSNIFSMLYVVCASTHKWFVCQLTRQSILLFRTKMISISVACFVYFVCLFVCLSFVTYPVACLLFVCVSNVLQCHFVSSMFSISYHIISLTRAMWWLWWWWRLYAIRHCGWWNNAAVIVIATPTQRRTFIQFCCFAYTWAFLSYVWLNERRFRPFSFRLVVEHSANWLHSKHWSAQHTYVERFPTFTVCYYSSQWETNDRSTCTNTRTRCFRLCGSLDDGWIGCCWRKCIAIFVRKPDYSDRRIMFHRVKHRKPKRKRTKNGLNATLHRMLARKCNCSSVVSLWAGRRGGGCFRMRRIIY